MASIGSDEEFAHHSLVVANIDNDSSGDGTRDLCPGPPITIHTLIIAWRFCVRVDCSPAFCVCLRERAEKIVTGSFNGVLRVYYPRQRDYKIDDLMLEQSLDQPIIGLLAGRFTACVR